MSASSQISDAPWRGRNFQNVALGGKLGSSFFKKKCDWILGSSDAFAQRCGYWVTVLEGLGLRVRLRLRPLKDGNAFELSKVKVFERIPALPGPKLCTFHFYLNDFGNADPI